MYWCIFLLKASTRTWNIFWWNINEIVYSNTLLNSKIHLPSLVVIEYQKYSTNERILLEKSVLASRYYLSLTWTRVRSWNNGMCCMSLYSFGQFETSDYTPHHSRGPHQGQQLTTFTVNHQPQPTIFMRASKIWGSCLVWYQQVGMSLGEIPLNAVPYLIT